MSESTVLDVEYSYSKDDEAEVRHVVSSLERTISGKIRLTAIKGGAIDLLDWLQILTAFGIAVSLKPVLSEYFKGLLNADGLKEAGKRHRKEILAWLGELRVELNRLMTAIRTQLDSGIPRLEYRGREKALLLLLPLGRPCYVVLNHSAMNTQLAATLTDGIVRLVERFADGDLPADAPVYQLYFDQNTSQWKYLFAPTTEGMLNRIDRYVDLETGTTHYLTSRADFIHLFNPDEQDMWKFIVCPFRGTPSFDL